MLYSAFAPLVVPVGGIYFGYRYVVDKYNFLFVYRVRGFPAGNDGSLMDRVLCIMRFCVVLFLLSMLLLTNCCPVITTVLSQLYCKAYRLSTTLLMDPLIMRCSHNLHLNGILMLNDICAF
nr:CSC1-like protein At4g35870 [Ipomoea batatas]